MLKRQESKEFAVGKHEPMLQKVLLPPNSNLFEMFRLQSPTTWPNKPETILPTGFDICKTSQGWVGVN